MYHAHFALREEPFGTSPDYRFFMPTEQHREALATLYYGVKERRGFALLIGNAGLGKTSVVVKLLQILEGKAESVYLPHPYFDRGTVLEAILHALGAEPGASIADNFRRLKQHLIEIRKAGKTCVVIFDEAHELDRDTLEVIRMLSNAETPSEKLIQIVLCGQPRLAETLQQPHFEQLRQRCSIVARLQPLNGEEVADYMVHRLRLVGAQNALFAREAVETIASASGGVPRNVNTLSFNSLTLAYALNHAQVGRKEVEEVIRDLDLRATTELVPYRTPERVIRGPMTAMNRISIALRSNVGMVLAASLFLLLSWFTGIVVTNYR